MYILLESKHQIPLQSLGIVLKNSIPPQSRLTPHSKITLPKTKTDCFIQFILCQLIKFTKSHLRLPKVHCDFFPPETDVCMT